MDISEQKIAPPPGIKSEALQATMATNGAID
jgi:hypothetical protein